MIKQDDARKCGRGQIPGGAVFVFSVQYQLVKLFKASEQKNGIDMILISERIHLNRTTLCLS